MCTAFRHAVAAAALALVLCAAAIAQSPSRTQAVVVHTTERTLARRLHQSISGDCAGRGIIVDFPFGQGNAEPTVSVTIADRTRTYGPSEEFVRDLAYDTSKFDSLVVACNGPLFELGVSGISVTEVGIGTPRVHFVLSDPWRATVVFSPDGAVRSYSRLRHAP